MAENIESAQNGSSDSPTPPQLNIPVPKLRDIDRQIEQWECVKLPTDVLLLTMKDDSLTMKDVHLQYDHPAKQDSCRMEKG